MRRGATYDSWAEEADTAPVEYPPTPRSRPASSNAAQSPVIKSPPPKMMKKSEDDDADEEAAKAMHSDETVTSRFMLIRIVIWHRRHRRHFVHAGFASRLHPAKRRLHHSKKHREWSKRRQNEKKCVQDVGVMCTAARMSRLQCMGVCGLVRSRFLPIKCFLRHCLHFLSWPYAMGKTTKPTKTSKSAVIAKKGKMRLVQTRVAVMKSFGKKCSAFSWTTQGTDQVEANSP